MAGLAMIDGQLGPLGSAVIPVTDPAFTLGWSVFESLLAGNGVAWALDAHLDRLERSAAAARVPWPGRERLVDEVAALIEASGGSGRIRVTLTAGGRRVLVSTPVDLGRWGAPVRCVRGPHRDEPFLGGRPKHASRAPWAVAVARSGVDDVLLVDAEGRFTEGTTCGIIAVVGGVLFAAPDDGRILQSTMVDAVLMRATVLGLAAKRVGALASGPWDALYVASSTRGLAPVIELDQAPLPGWDPVGRRIAEGLLPTDGA